jgi:hypothetical protein
VYPVHDVGALTEALRRVLSSPEIAATMGQHALRRIDAWNFDANIRGLREAIAAVCPRVLPDRYGSLRSAATLAKTR